MFSNPIILLTVSTVLAAIPAGIWLYLILKKTEKGKKIIALVFFLGCLTTIADLGLQILWSKPGYEWLNLEAHLARIFQSGQLAIISNLLLFVLIEELIKFYVVKTIDKKTVLINTVNDALRFSLASALGFSFMENIYYLYVHWNLISSGEIISMYIFRSLFSTCGHLIYSGIFGYYYGIGKFSITMSQEQKLTGSFGRLTRFLARLLQLPMSAAYRQQFIYKGFILAVFMHLTSNYLLQFNKIPPVIIFVVLGFLYLAYLLKRKAGHLVLLIDPSIKKASTMAKKDEEVVIELLVMWFKDKRYVDVLHICERLLERDPDNHVVQLFKARALDAMDKKDIYRQILGTVVKTKNDLSNTDRNIISKHLEEKKKLQQGQNTIK